jgi:hypothetical protein
LAEVAEVVEPVELARAFGWLALAAVPVAIQENILHLRKSGRSA